MLPIFIAFMIVAMVFAIATLIYVAIDFAHEKATKKKEMEEPTEVGQEETVKPKA